MNSKKFFSIVYLFLLVILTNASVCLANPDAIQGIPISSFPTEVDATLLTQIETPTKVFDKPWIYTRANARGRTDRCNLKSGKWVIFVPNNLADSAWAVVKSNVEQDQLGFAAKSSTMSSSKEFVNRVFIVYTCDWTDKGDVMRVRQKLRELGFTEEIYYKTDDMTRQRIYGQAERDLAPYRN